MAENDSPEITLESISQVEDINTLTDEQKTFIQENADQLDETQRETYKEIIESKKEEDDGELDPEKIEIETRKKPKAEGKSNEASDDDDADIDPEDAKKIDRIVQKRLKESGVEFTQNQIEVDSFIRSKPEYNRYRSVALKYMDHPDYKNIPVHNIMAIVAAKDMQALGAKKEREASMQSKNTQHKGSTNRQTSNKTYNWATASREEVEAKKAEVLGRQGV